VEGDATPKKERKALKAEFCMIVRPKPNFLFGFRPKLFIYKIAGTPKSKDFVIKTGEAPASIK
jgi:hypothetical protein